jgi:G3E family GTPase|tara:strand:+ start:1572 stop:2396 length:825 start_codon:yes stop_codon:yes gene_type:complete
MIPVTVVAGYLGSGKTTLINQFLKETESPIAVLVNDFGELNIDAELIDNQDSLTLSLTNGCVCCKLSDDIGVSLESLKGKDITAVIIEASGISLPIKIANYGLSWPGFSLKGILAVADGQSIGTLLEDKFVGYTVKGQIEQADAVLLNRSYGLSLEALNELNKNIFLEEEVSNYGDLLSAKYFAKHFIEENPKEHATFQSSIFTSNKPIKREDIKKYILLNPNIQRAKGWVCEENGVCSLLQMTPSECNFSPSDFKSQTRVVFIYTGKLSPPEF